MTETEKAAEQRKIDSKRSNQELMKITQELSEPRKTPMRKHVPYEQMKKQRSTQRRFLAGGVALLAIGVLSAGYMKLTRPPESESGIAEVPPDPRKGTDEEKQIRKTMQLKASRFARPDTVKSKPLPVCNHGAERDRFLKTLAVDGKPPAFIPVSELKFAEGKSTTLYCLLQTPMPEAIESMWQSAGMFQNEPEIINPYVRLVTVSTPQARAYLNDANVEGVAVGLSPVSQ